jgi:hypothetical protein
MKEQFNDHPSGPKSSFYKHVLDRAQESEEEVAGEGAEEDEVASIAKDIESEISKFKTWSILPFYDND